MTPSQDLHIYIPYGTYLVGDSLSSSKLSFGNLELLFSGLSTSISDPLSGPFPQQPPPGVATAVYWLDASGRSGVWCGDGLPSSAGPSSIGVSVTTISCCSLLLSPSFSLLFCLFRPATMLSRLATFFSFLWSGMSNITTRSMTLNNTQLGWTWPVSYCNTIVPTLPSLLFILMLFLLPLFESWWEHSRVHVSLWQAFCV